MMLASKRKNTYHIYRYLINLHYIHFPLSPHRNELQIGGVYIRIYNEMPTFPIAKPKQFIMDLLEYLKQAYHYLTTSNSTGVKIVTTPTSIVLNSIGQDGILTPTLAPNHPQLQPAKTGKTFDEVLNAYNRSKIRNKIEASALLEQQQMQQQYRYDFANDVALQEHVIMVLQALMAVIKCNAEVEIQCIGSFNMIFGFLAHNLFNEVGYYVI